MKKVEECQKGKKKVQHNYEDAPAPHDIAATKLISYHLFSLFLANNFYLERKTEISIVKTQLKCSTIHHGKGLLQ